MRAKDWAATPLGDPTRWPQSLKTVVRIILDSRYAMWMGWGQDLTFFYNDAYARDTLGKKHPWALARPAREVWAEIWSDIGPRINRVLHTGQATWDEGLLLFLERNGYPEETYHTFSYSPLYDDGGKMGGMLCVVTEETERVIAERRVTLLRDLAAALTTTKTETYVFDDNADMRQYVQRLLSSRYDVGSVGDGREALKAVRERRPDLVLSDVMMPNLDGFGLLRELRGHPETAQVPVILLSARAGEESTLEGLSAGADDYLVKPFSARELLGRIAAVLERKRFQRAIAEADDRLSIALDAARMAAWDWDPATDVLHISDTVDDVFGLAPGASFQSSKQGLMHVHPDDAAAHMARLQKAIGNLAAFHSQFRIIRPIDGQIAWMEERGIARRDDATGGVRLVGVVMDVTEAKRAEEERERLLERERAARGDAERASRLKEEFLTTLSHELRTPLNAILGWSQILEKAGHDAATVAEGVSVISRNARAQTQLIEDLLDMSRIISGKLRLEVERVDLSDVVAAAIESVRPAADARDIRLVKVLDSVRTIVSGDPHRLQQVVWNLLSNAIKFTPKGGRVQVVLARINSHVEIRVIDNGHGIAPAFLPHVFERFRQADASTKRMFGGLGLGLSIVKQLVELHGGTVTAESPGEGLGTTLTVSLPLAVAHTDDDQGRSASSEMADDAALKHISLDRVKVLVVDDEPDARNLVKCILSDCKAEVITASSAAEAIPLVQSELPDVIVSDIGMPDRDGYELLRMVRRLRPDQGGSVPARSTHRLCPATRPPPSPPGRLSVTCG